MCHESQVKRFFMKLSNNLYPAASYFQRIRNYVVFFMFSLFWRINLWDFKRSEFYKWHQISPGSKRLSHFWFKEREIQIFSKNTKITLKWHFLVPKSTLYTLHFLNLVLSENLPNSPLRSDEEKKIFLAYMLYF